MVLLPLEITNCAVMRKNVYLYARIETQTIFYPYLIMDLI